MLISAYKRNLPSQIREKSYSIIGSIQQTAFNFEESIGECIKNFYEAKELREENELLKIEIDKLLFEKENYFKEILSSYQRFEKLLEFKQKKAYHLLPVRVISYTPSIYFKVVFIDKGGKEGIKKGMAVVSPQGLVGKVIEEYSHQAKVLLIIDERSKVGIRVQRTRDIAILQGKGKEGVCELKYLLNTASVKVGDKVVASGLGNLFPEGILVGKISEVKRDSNRLFQEVKITPTVDFGKLEELFVIKKW